MSSGRLLSFIVCCTVLLPLAAANPGHIAAQDVDAGSWFDIAPSTHAGLLGKRHISGRYAYISHGDQLLNRFDRGFDGFSVGLNHPIIVPSDELWLGVDLFASWGTLGLGGATHFQPGNVGVQLDSETSQTAVGATLYADLLEPIRPLVQIGAGFSRNRSLLLIDGLGGTTVDHDTSFLLRTGLEADVTDWMAVRGVVDIDTAGELQDGAFLGDVIVWPAERLFVRSGLIAPFRGAQIGGHFRIGITF